MVLLVREEAVGCHTVPDLLRVLRVDIAVWDSFCAVAGDPRNDLRLLTAVPPWTLTEICSRVTLADRWPFSNPGGAGGAGLAQCKMDHTPEGEWRSSEHCGQRPGTQTLVVNLLPLGQEQQLVLAQARGAFSRWQTSWTRRTTRS